MWRLKWLVIVLLTAASVALFVALPKSASATAGNEPYLSFEGKVGVTSTGVNIPNATYNMEFQVYSGGTATGGGTLEWTESWLVSNSQGVTFNGGTFQVNLGSICSFTGGSCQGNTNTGINWNSYPLYLTIEVGNTSSTSNCDTSSTFMSNCGGDGVMSPYILLTSSPYAFDAGELGGLTASQLVQLTPGIQQTGSINVSGNIQSAGTVQATTLDTPSSGTLTVGSTNATAITLSDNTTLTSGKTLTAGGQTVISGTGIIQPAAVSGSYTGITGLGTVTAGTWNASTLNPAYGGTGQSSYTIGDLLYASASTTLSELHDAATGDCLISGGVAVAPTWGSCGSSSGANTALSNLASVAINTSLLPGTTNSSNVGSAALTFANGYYGTALQSPLLDSAASGTLGLGTSNATSITVGSSSGTASTVAINSGAALNLGNNAVNKTINLGATGSTANTSAINIGTSTAATQTIDLGGTGASGASASGSVVTIQGGATEENISNTGALIQTYTNSQLAFEVQNANSVPVFVVDTATTNNLLSNPGFEAGTTGWAPDGTGAGIAPNSTKADVYNGQASLKVTTSTTANVGAETTSFIGGSPAAGTYTLSFEALGGTASITGLAASLGTGTCTLNSTSLITTGFQRYYCTVTTTAATSTITFTVATTSATFYIDAVQLVSGSSLTPYQIGAIQLRGVINNPVAFEATSNSTTALQVETNAAINLLYVDSVNNVIQVGSQTANTNGITLGLNNYNATLGTEPAVYSGAMYYNSTINQFRCGVNGAWENCGGLDIANSATATCTVSATATSCVPNNYFTTAAPSIPANYCTTGRVIHVFAAGIYTGTTATTMTFSIRLGTTIIGAASGAPATGTTASSAWNVNFYITCDSTTTVTGEGTATVFTSGTASTTSALAGTGTTTVSNTSAQSIEAYINVGTAADMTSITMEQFIVQGL